MRNQSRNCSAIHSLSQSRTLDWICMRSSKSIGAVTKNQSQPGSWNKQKNQMNIRTMNMQIKKLGTNTTSSDIRRCLFYTYNWQDIFYNQEVESFSGSFFKKLVVTNFRVVILSFRKHKYLALLNFLSWRLFPMSNVMVELGEREIINSSCYSAYFSQGQWLFKRWRVNMLSLTRNWTCSKGCARLE